MKSKSKKEFYDALSHFASFDRQKNFSLETREWRPLETDRGRRVRFSRLINEKTKRDWSTYVKETRVRCELKMLTISMVI